MTLLFPLLTGIISILIYTFCTGLYQIIMAYVRGFTVGHEVWSWRGDIAKVYIE